METVLDPRHPLLLWVRVHTDDGVVGLGETVGQPRAAARAVHDQFAGILIGEDPLRIEQNWQRGFRALNYHGTGGAEMRALSAIDIALWDILGKVTDQPVYQLLGGACRDRIPIYNTCGNYGESRDRDRFLEDPGGLAEELLAEGITAMKVWPFDDLAARTDGQHVNPEALDKGVACIAAIRRAVGEKMEIAIEGHGLWNLPSAIRIARALEPYRPLWIEDLIWPDNINALAELRRATSIPVIASERLLTRFRFAELIAQHAADIVMPDLAWSGGISEGMKVAALASANQLPIAPHNCGGPFTHLVTAHFCAHIPNLLAMETIRSFYRGFFEDYVTAVPRPTGGALELPPGPGFGAELRPEILGSKGIEIELSQTSNADGRGRARGDPWSATPF
jgi:galactonate dehydratase